ncbi:MAG: dihydropteroate synthase [Bacteroidales bacterium]|nr:dihydropteroate synthase [Bacteroidales bacterium]
MGNKDTSFSGKYLIHCRATFMDLSVPRIMGIVNVTPDSFYEGSQTMQEEAVMKQADRMVCEGVDIVDVGGYSSRPGAEHISQQEELSRLLPALEKIRAAYPDLILSVDTFRPEVARIVVEDYDVDIINDISAGEMGPSMFETIADLNVPYIMMHMKGTPQNMKEKAHYQEMMKEITRYFSARVDGLRRLGVKDIILDPGFGFGKTIDHNYQLLSRLEELKIFGLPLMVGLSRKSMIYKVLNVSPDQALNGTTVLNTLALERGANLLRVHDVKQAREIITLKDKMERSAGSVE